MGKAIARINVSRVIIGGFAAGLILFVAAAIVNAELYKNHWENWKDMMGSHIHPPAMGMSMALWFALNMLLGFVGVTIYASIRPRFGAGPKTALFAGLLLWLSSNAPSLLDRKALGILPESIVNGQFVAGFAAILVAVFTGAWLYKE